MITAFFVYVKRNIMDRLDFYEIRPEGFNAYLANYGYHFSKKMFEFAVGMMKDKGGNRLQITDRDKVNEILKANSITLDNDKGYDAAYVYNMAKSDFFGSAISDESHLAKYVKDYLDDKDGYSSIAFSRFYADCVAKGTPILWETMI